MKRYMVLFDEGDSVEAREIHRLNYNIIEAKKLFFDKAGHQESGDAKSDMAVVTSTVSSSYQ